MVILAWLGAVGGIFEPSVAEDDDCCDPGVVIWVIDCACGSGKIHNTVGIAVGVVRDWVRKIGMDAATTIENGGAQHKSCISICDG